MVDAGPEPTYEEKVRVPTPPSPGVIPSYWHFQQCRKKKEKETERLS